LNGLNWDPLVVGSDGSFSMTTRYNQPLGENNYIIVVSDPAGNVTTRDLTVQIENTAPMPAAVKMVNSTDSGYFDNDRISREASPEFEVELSSGLQPGAEIDFQIRNSSSTNSTEQYRATRTLTQADIDNGTLSFAVPDGTTLPDQQLYVAARTIDLAGNESAWKGMNLGAVSGSYNLQVETREPVKPSTPVLMSADGDTDPDTQAATTERNRLFTLTGSIPSRSGDDSLLDTVYVDIYDALPDGSEVKLGRAGVTNGEWAFTYTGNALRQGSHSIIVRGTDLAGNVSPDSTARELVIDNDEQTTEPQDRIPPTLVGGATFDGNQLR
jgi:hypothetical protein